jgi:hypothetical protein
MFKAGFCPNVRPWRNFERKNCIQNSVSCNITNLDIIILRRKSVYSWAATRWNSASEYLQQFSLLYRLRQSLWIHGPATACYWPMQHTSKPLQTVCLSLCKLNLESFEVQISVSCYVRTVHSAASQDFFSRNRAASRFDAVNGFIIVRQTHLTNLVVQVVSRTLLPMHVSATYMMPESVHATEQLLSF